MFIRGQCQCDFQRRFIVASIINCVEQMPPQIVYLANVSSYTTYSTDQLIDYINDWATGDPVIQTQANESMVVENCICPKIPSATLDDVCTQLEQREPTQVLYLYILLTIHSSVDFTKFSC